MTNQMKAAVLHAPGDLRVESVAKPANPGPDEVIVQVKAAGICGSDLDRVMKTGTYSFPTIPGHEFCGVVSEVGAQVENFKINDRVLVTPILPCFKCDYCQQGNYGQCENYNYLGSRTDGGFAEFVKAPARNLIPLPSEISFIEGAAIEPSAVTLHGMIKVGVHSGDQVAVLGCGPIGLFAIQFAKILGATKVIAVDIAPDKLDMALVAGADEVINALNEDPVSRIIELTNGKGTHLTIETAGVARTQEQAIRTVKKLGRILYLGTAHQDVVIPPKTFEIIVRNEVQIVGAWNSYSAPFPGVEWQAVIDYLRSGKFKLKPFITRTVPLDEINKIIPDMAARKFPFNKIVVKI